MTMSANAREIPRATLTNGVDVGALFDTIAAIKQDPEIASFKFRATNRWLGADRNRTTVAGFYGAKQEQPHAQAFEMECGEPAVLLGADRGANPVEFLLNALIGCLTTTMVYHAASRAIEIQAVDSELEGDLDLRGFLGISPEIRKGYSAIRVKMRVQSKGSPSVLRELARYSPVYDVVSRALPVEIEVVTC
jgi:uncharacterized OsmC-like protein